MAKNDQRARNRFDKMLIANQLFRKTTIQTYGETPYKIKKIFDI